MGQQHKEKARLLPGFLLLTAQRLFAA